MSKGVSIEINGVAYPLKFGYAAMRLLGGFLKIDTYDGTAAKVSQVLGSLTKQEKEGGSLSFEVLDVIGFLVLSAVVSKEAPSHGDIVNKVINTPGEFTVVMEAWAKSMPQVKKGSPVPEKKSTQRKKA